MIFDINWGAIWNQIRRIIDVLTKRFFQTKAWIDEYTEEESSTGE